MSPKCTFDFKKKKFNGKFIDNEFKKYKKYLLKISKKRGKFEKNGEFYISKKYQLNLVKTLEKALLNLSRSRLKRKLPIPKRKVFLEVVEQKYIYELNLNNDKVVIHPKSKNLGKNFEIFKMNYAMLLGLITRHFTWTNIEEDINYYRKPNTYDENLHFLMNFLAL